MSTLEDKLKAQAEEELDREFEQTHGRSFDLLQEEWSTSSPSWTKGECHWHLSMREPGGRIDSMNTYELERVLKLAYVQKNVRQRTHEKLLAFMKKVDALPDVPKQG